MTENNEISLDDLYGPVGVMIAISVIANAILYYIGLGADAFGPETAINPMFGMPINIFNVIVLSALSPVFASIVYQYLYNRDPETAKRIFLIIAIIVFVVFFPAPLLFLESTTTMTIVFLEVMHVISTIAIVYILFNYVGAGL